MSYKPPVMCFCRMFRKGSFRFGARVLKRYGQESSVPGVGRLPLVRYRIPRRVQRPGVCLRVAVMLGERSREGVRARQVVLGAEIEIVVVFVIEHGIDRSDRRHADRPGRQTRMPVGVVRGIDFEMLVQHPPDRKVSEREADRRIGLKRHALFSRLM